MEDTKTGDWKETKSKVFNIVMKFDNGSHSANQLQGMDEAIMNLLRETHQQLLNQVIELVDKHDPSSNRETSLAYWGNTLRADLKSLLENKRDSLT